uniref:Immunoglobulin subtype domain-containing protein n=1 Tax=Esox lucius TaxID=8010 RepID=A0AAY5JYC6_ESOLU
ESMPCRIKYYFHKCVFFTLYLGLESHCDVSKVGVHCYGALDGTVYLRLDIEYNEICLIKDPSGKPIELFKRKNKTNFMNGSLKHRSEFYFNNGTLKIRNIERSDAGEYSSETFNSSGITITSIRFQLSIEGKYPTVKTLIS